MTTLGNPRGTDWKNMRKMWEKEDHETETRSSWYWRKRQKWQLPERLRYRLLSVTKVLVLMMWTKPWTAAACFTWESTFWGGWGGGCGGPTTFKLASLIWVGCRGDRRGGKCCSLRWGWAGRWSCCDCREWARGGRGGGLRHCGSEWISGGLWSIRSWGRRRLAGVLAGSAGLSRWRMWCSLWVDSCSWNPHFS